MTRKNLKSIALKQNIMQSDMYGGNSLGGVHSLAGGPNLLMQNLSNISANEGSQQL